MATPGSPRRASALMTAVALPAGDDGRNVLETGGGNRQAHLGIGVRPGPESAEQLEDQALVVDDAGVALVAEQEPRTLHALVWGDRRQQAQGEVRVGRGV